MHIQLVRELGGALGRAARRLAPVPSREVGLPDQRVVGSPDDEDLID